MTEEPAMKRALLFSAGLHLAMVLLLFLPTFSLGRRVLVPAVHDVRLIELPRVVAPPRPAATKPAAIPPAPKPPAPKPMAPRPPAPKPISSIAPVPPKPAVVPPEPEAVPETAPDTQETSPPSDEQALVPSAPVISTPSMLPRIDAPEFDCSDYCRAFQRKVESQWAPPPMSGGDVGQAIVVFTINRNGTVDGVAIEASSGNFYFDQAALRAILLAAPLPPLPRAFSSPTLRVHLAFTLQPSP